jgi:hypothetical protein
VFLKCSTSRDSDGKLLFVGACAGCRLAGLEVECSFHGQFIIHLPVYLAQSNKFGVNVQNPFSALALKKPCLCAVVLMAVLSCGMMPNPPRVYHAFRHPRDFDLCPTHNETRLLFGQDLPKAEREQLQTDADTEGMRERFGSKAGLTTRKS